MGSWKNENKPERPIWPTDKNPQALATQSLAYETDFFPIHIPFQQTDFCGLFKGGEGGEFQR